MASLITSEACSSRSCYDVVIVGGGIVGLATSYQLLRRQPALRLLLLEKEETLAAHQTGHNSGVIHSGLYYKSGSLKANLCRQGAADLIEFCREYAINHEVCGKLVVATNEKEVDQLQVLEKRGIANGLDGIRRVGAAEIKEREPYCAGVAGLLIPQTGIVDYGKVASQLAALVEAGDGQIHCSESVLAVDIQSSDPQKTVEITTPKAHYRAGIVIFCAGLQSDRLARQQDPDLPLRIIPFRGEYYQLKPQAQQLVNHLIYPVPDPAFPFLGAHFTRMISGGVECGPNAVLSLAREGYGRFSIDWRDLYEIASWPGFHTLAQRYWRQGLDEFWRSWNKQAFVTALQKLIPSITAADLVSGGAGIRAQACERSGSLVDDFLIREVGPILHVCNAPSPAATASLAIGDALAGLVQRRLENG